MKYVGFLLALCLLGGCTTTVDRQGSQQDVLSPGLWLRQKQADRTRPVNPTQINDRIAEIDPEMGTVNLLVAQGLSPEKALEAVKEISSNRSQFGYGGQRQGLRGGGSPAHPNFRASQSRNESQPGVIVNRTADWQRVTIARQAVQSDGTIAIELLNTYEVSPLVRHTDAHNNYVSISLLPGDYQITIVGGSTENKHIDSDPTDTWVGLDDTVGGPSLSGLGWAHIIR